MTVLSSFTAYQSWAMHAACCLGSEQRGTCQHSLRKAKYLSTWFLQGIQKLIYLIEGVKILDGDTVEAAVVYAEPLTATLLFD